MWLGDAPGRARAEEAEETSVVRGRRGAHGQERCNEHDEAHSVRHDKITLFANRIGAIGNFDSYPNRQ